LIDFNNYDARTTSFAYTSSSITVSRTTAAATATRIVSTGNSNST
jgi:hypothetical protein